MISFGQHVPPFPELPWIRPGTTNKEVIPGDLFDGPDLGQYPTGVSVDSFGKLWVANLASGDAMRIDPEAGARVVTQGVTNRVGAVDMVVDLGDGSFHPEPYNQPAWPYNYSDMTGFNNRIVNPGGQPLKGYWTVMEDSGRANEFWERVSWNAALTNGGRVEVWVRAGDDRIGLANEPFLRVSNNVPLIGVNGRFLEVRLALVRDQASQQPVLYDLTLHGRSTVWTEGGYVDYWWPVFEGEDVVFWPVMEAPGPFTYQWYVQYPWMAAWDWAELAGETNATYRMTNVDTWVEGTLVKARVVGGTGESIWIDAAELFVGAVGINLPESGFSGPASRYPSTIHVFGQPANINSVVVTLWGLSHSRSADLNLLLLSPSGKRIILMSNVGGTNGVSNASITFRQGWAPPGHTDPLLQPNQYYVQYGPSNYGAKTPQIPFGLPVGPYSSDLQDLQGDNPNGDWELYIHDDLQPGGRGELVGSWSLEFTF